MDIIKQNIDEINWANDTNLIPEDLNDQKIIKLIEEKKFQEIKKRVEVIFYFEFQHECDCKKRSLDVPYLDLYDDEDSEQEFTRVYLSLQEMSEKIKRIFPQVVSGFIFPPLSF